MFMPFLEEIPYTLIHPGLSLDCPEPRGNSIRSAPNVKSRRKTRQDIHLNVINLILTGQGRAG